MKALMYLGIGQLGMREVPDPTDDFILKISGCGICGTDLKAYLKGHHMFTPPTILGHEFYGRVAKAPAGCGYKEGDLAVVAPYYECGVCGTCKNGAGELCQNKAYVDGGAFCEYVGLASSYISKGVFKLGAEDDVYTLVEPLACVLNGVSHLKLHASSRVLIVGSGPMGALFALLFKARGIPCAVIEPAPLRRKMVASWGIEAYEPGAEGIGSYDNVVIAVNKAELFDQYLRGVSDAGTVLMFSGLKKEETVTLDSQSIHYREVTVTGSFGYALPQFREALELIKAHRETFEKVITHRLPLEEGQKGFDLLAAGEAFKIILKP